MFRRIIFVFVLFFATSAICFGQASALRDYVGLISIHYHQDVIDYMGKFKELFEKRGYPDVAKAIDDYLKGLSGSGFVYVAPNGTNYILTNEHVIAQSESLSITFEKLDGTKTTYDGLKVLLVDEEKDLAILTFDAGARPFTRGLSLSTVPAVEGGDVFAAGFPGMANTAIWQFSRGTVSNAAVRLPKNENHDELFGPFIQHTAQIDPGNSGGPLLIAAPNVPTGYSVVGINTLSAVRRQAANYAIPADQINTFIAAALSTQPVNEQELISARVDEFINGLDTNRAVYNHIARFLSTACTASNAEYAISELVNRAPRGVVSDIGKIFGNDPVQGMNVAVAYHIERSMRPRSGAIKITLDSIEPNDKGGFDVMFNVNNTTIKSEWIKEYGVYRMDTYGDVATGDKTVLEERQRRTEQEKALRTNYDFSISAGYAYVLDYGSAFTAELSFDGPGGFGFELVYGEKGYFQLGINAGVGIPIRLGSFAIIPFGNVGINYISTDLSKRYNDFGEFGFGAGLSLKGGIVFTTAAVPGLFASVSYNHNFVFMTDYIPNTGVIGISVGYGF